MTLAICPMASQYLVCSDQHLLYLIAPHAGGTAQRPQQPNRLLKMSQTYKKYTTIHYI